MTAKYFRGLAGIEKIKERTCTLCIHARPFKPEDIYHIECGCERSDHFCHVIMIWHPACDEYEQGLKPEIGDQRSEKSRGE